jgi:hypothetical protein
MLADAKYSNQIVAKDFYGTFGNQNNQSIPMFYRCLLMFTDVLPMFTDVY